MRHYAMPIAGIQQSSIAHIAMDSLLAASSLHERLGESGAEVVKKNKFGQTSLRIDVECEQIIIETLRKSGLPFRIISEEYGQTDVSARPELLAVLDGLDGTKTYRKERGHGRYGTMLGIFSNINPKYQEYIFSGVAEHALQRIVFGIRGKGAYIRRQNSETSTHSTGSKQLHTKTKIGIDDYFPFNRDIYLPVFGYLPQIKQFASESRYVDVATGIADLALECSRKGNLEIAAAYGLIREAGGAIVDEEGEEIGLKEYLEFAQDSQRLIITAATPELAKIAVEELRRWKKFKRE